MIITMSYFTLEVEAPPPLHSGDSDHSFPRVNGALQGRLQAHVVTWKARSTVTDEPGDGLLVRELKEMQNWEN